MCAGGITGQPDRSGASDNRAPRYAITVVSRVFVIAFAFENAPKFTRLRMYVCTCEQGVVSGPANGEG